MRDEIINLVERHCETMRQEAADIAALIGNETCPSGDSHTKALAIAHKLKGSSGTIGFTEISHTAQTLEDALRDVVAGEPTPKGLAAVIAANDALQQIIAETDVQDSTLYQRFR